MQIHIHIDGRVAKVFGNRAVRKGLFLAAVLVPCMAVAATSVPNTFQSGTTISSSDMNANFTSVTSSLNTFDGRVTALEAAHNAPTQAGIYAYATSLDANSTPGTTFNSSGGGVTIAGTTGDYAVTFDNIACVANNQPVGAATVVPFNLSTAVNCRIDSYVQVAAACKINVRCFDSTGNLRPGAISLTYVH